MENTSNSKLVVMMCMIDGKVDAIMDGVAQIIAKQENKDFKIIIESMAKKASEYAETALELLSKEVSDNNQKIVD